VDFNSDEVRRELRDVNADQKAVDKAWTEALKRIFDAKSNVSEAEKAAFLGMPTRRQLFKIGGVTLLGSALFAACGSDNKDKSSSETTAGGGETSTTAKANMDLTLAKTAASLEALAVATYMPAAGSGKVKTAAVGAAASMFMDHHKKHQDALNGVITGAGATAITEPNAAVKAAIVDPSSRTPPRRSEDRRTGLPAGNRRRPDLHLRRRSVVDAGVAVDDHDHRRYRSPPRIHHWVPRPEEADVDDLPGVVLQVRQPIAGGRHHLLTEIPLSGFPRIPNR
jgi:hypothetical protein